MPGVLRPPSLSVPLGVPGERLPCRDGCSLAKGFVYQVPRSLKDVFRNGLLLRSFLEVFIGDLVLPLDLRIFLRQVLIKTWIYFIQVTVVLQVLAP
ncbi:hypothetical protein DPMN_168126 [Dreissena polymorpha]|uniref:Uncharacterized protein n=1 Tax=Dreissena polymorpha TaxID=45954 RepID=A0A9D4IZ05_DREPO|nr:hypothetical protein DPMN_168126 [Dreissena polymorpha]